METKLHVYRATVRLWKCGPKDHVYDQCDRGGKFELSKSDEERCISQ